MTPSDRTFSSHPHSARACAAERERGFTLVELMITLTVLALVLIALTGVLYTATRSKGASTNNIESSQGGRVAMDMMARDLRSAGYGADLNWTLAPQPAIAYIDSMQVLISENITPYPDTTGGGHAWPMAYQPTGGPRPRPLDGTSWQPPIKYRTGAELVRWTLDVNNDGVVDASDVSDPNGTDAAHTPNPNDYVLVRQTYGDSTGNVAGNNGGTLERVALVRRPGDAGTPPMFTVYMKGSATAWDWANGPVPAAQLSNVSRVVVQVTAPSSKADWRGRYAQNTFRTDVNSMRNVPNWGAPQYTVDGYVYNDVNKNNVKDSGEPGVSGAGLTLGMYSASTASSGYFTFRIPAGTYTLRHAPPGGFGCRTKPDSFVVTVGPDVQRSFADTVSTGGWVNAHVYNDTDKDGTQDAGEPSVKAVKLTLSSTSVYTDTSGNARLFAPVGGWSVTCTAPESCIVTSTNPVTGTFANGDSTTIRFGVAKNSTGTIRGTVYVDNNKNGSKESAEVGIQNVWVGVSGDGGVSYAGYTYTDASGNYSIDVPINDPPHTTAYIIDCVPPAGYFPTSTSTLTGIWLQSAQILTGKNFGMSSFTVISLNASRVLSLGSGDLVEKDWNGSHTENAHGDADIVLGADAAGTDQISVWFNDWNSSPLFSASPSYTQTAPNSVMSIALDTLDNVATRSRYDLVAGTKLASAGNFFVYYTRGSGNEGYFPTTASASYKTTDQGDVQAVVTGDVAGGSGVDYPDIIVGTKGPSAGFGSIEVWRSNNATTPTFTREETYGTTTFGGITAGGLGEVTCMALADMDNDGLKDLIVGTTKSNYSGQLLVLKNMGKAVSPHFLLMYTMNWTTDAITSLGIVDVDGDGYKDIIIGSQRSTSNGKLFYYRNSIPSTMTFVSTRTVDAPGIVLSISIADLGGSARGDCAIGYRTSTAGFGGGVRIYYLDSGTLPSSSTDPSNGTIVNMVPALTSNNFNFGSNPNATAPFLQDLAAGVKSGVSTGALVVFIR